jgi:hypothetical protein
VTGDRSSTPRSEPLRGVDGDDDWQRQHAERVEQMLAHLVEAVRLVADILSELVPDRRSR